jgi:hypothetical protein
MLREPGQENNEILRKFSISISWWDEADSKRKIKDPIQTGMLDGMLTI